jgi:transposase
MFGEWNDAGILPATGRRRDERAVQRTDCRWRRTGAGRVVAFRGIDAQRILKEEFAIDCSLSSTYRLLHRIKLSWLAPLATRMPMRRRK